MDSKPQSLCSPFPCTAANGRRGPKQLSSSPETGDARPKPPVKPKPCVLPKPAIPAKTTPVLRQALSEVPSAEKINLLAGPKPYSSGAGHSVKHLSFSFKGPPKEATNGKEVSPPSADGEESGSAKQPSVAEEAFVDEYGESSSVRKCAVPFKVKPLPVAAKPERFPGTTVEEILAKIEKPSKEVLESPDKPRLVHTFFSQDGGTAVHLGPKGYSAFRRCSSGEEGREMELKGPVYRVSHEESRLSKSKEDTTSSNGQHATESEQPATERDVCFHSRDSSSSPPSMSCDGGQPGLRSPPSPPGTYQPLSKLSSGITPGSPEAPAEPAQPPGAPYLHSTQAELPPGSPDVVKPLKSPTEVFYGLTQAPGSPLALADPCPPGSPSVSVETSLPPCPPSPSAKGLEGLLFLEPSLSVALTPPADHSPEIPSCLLGISESPGSPNTLSDYCVGSDQPPGSPSHAQESSRNQDSPKNHIRSVLAEDKAPHLSQLPLRRASEGVVQPQGKKGKEELGGSLATLPGGGPPLEQTALGESHWSLSQSFEWSSPNRTLEFGGRQRGSPPRFPIAEAEDTCLLETELGGNIYSSKRSYEERISEGLGRREAEAKESSPGCKDSQSLAVAQPESSSVLLQMPAPGGPSGGRGPSSHELKGPLMATECGFQEEDEGLLPFVPTHEDGALQAMEPLPSVEQSAAPTQPCISFSEDAQMQTAVASQEDEYVLDLVQDSRTGGADPPRGVEQDPRSCWLDELLSSPPPSADDTKRRSAPKLDDAIGPEDLLGWSRKDLCSEFGIGETSRSVAFAMGWAEEAVGSKARWPDETEQDREFGTGKWEWLSSYSVGDADRQNMKFATRPQDWARGAPLLDDADQGQEDWLTAYGSRCADQQIGESDWSSRYDIDSAECQNTQPYVRKPGWPKLCTVADQESGEFAVGNTDWSKYIVSATANRTDWPSSAENASCVDPEVNAKSSDDVSTEHSPSCHQDVQLGLRHSVGPDVDDPGPCQEAAFSACQSGWPNENSADTSTTEWQVGFSDQQLEQPSKCSASHSASHVIIQQRPLPDEYGFNNASCPESELSAKQSDWPTCFDLGVAQCQSSEFSVDKPDSINEYQDSQANWEREMGIASGGSTPVFGAGDAEFRAQKTVWTDAYILGGMDPQDSNFSAAARNWVRGAAVSGTEPKMQWQKNQGESFDPMDMSGLKMTIDLVETSDSLMGQTQDLRPVAMDGPRGVGEGQSDWTQDSLRGTSPSSLSKGDSPDGTRISVEMQPDWPSALGQTRLSSASDAGLVNPELPREPGVGQADLAYRSVIESKDVSDDRSKDLAGAEQAGPVEMDWTSGSQKEYHHQSAYFGAPCLGSGEMQHPGTSENPGERESHSEQLSSPSHLLEEMVANSAVKEVAQQKRPTSSHSCHSGEEETFTSLTDDQMTGAEKTRASPASVEVKEAEKVRSNGDGAVSPLDNRNYSQPSMETRRWSHPEQNGSQAAQPTSPEGHTTDGAGAPSGKTFNFLADTEVLDSTAYRDRANLGRKRGHRAPITRSGSALSEGERDSWMFKDSTEPQIVPAHSDEESSEEPRSRRPRNSPLSKGVKVPLFPGLSPSALKAKLRGRNRSAEEGDSHSEAKQSPAKEAHVHRSKSCKIASGKPLVLPPKPEKTSGSEASSPSWLQVLKLKKKKS